MIFQHTVVPPEMGRGCSLASEYFRQNPCSPSTPEAKTGRAVTAKLIARSNAVSFIKLLFLLKVVPEIIDPVVGPFQVGCIQHQVRTIEATNIRMMNLLLVIHPSIGRL
jgi:hypothetical protein